MVTKKYRFRGNENKYCWGSKRERDTIKGVLLALKEIAVPDKEKTFSYIMWFSYNQVYTKNNHVTNNVFGNYKLLILRTSKMGLRLER